MMAIHQNDLSDINNANNSTKNQELLQKLKSIQQNNGTIVLVDMDNTEINFAQTTKIAKKELNNKIIQAESILLTKASNASGIDQINNDAAAISNPLERQITLLAAQNVYQKAVNNNNIMRIAKSDINIMDLWKKYSTGYKKGNKSFFKVPGIPENIEINRARTLILVKKDGNIYGILGSEVYSPGGGGWFSGGSEKVDKDIQDTIIRETFEETSGVAILSRSDIDNAIKEGRYFYNAKNKTFGIIHADVHNHYNIEQMNASYQKIKHDKSIQSGMKEMSEYHYVSMNELNRFHTNVTPVATAANQSVRTLNTILSSGAPSTLRIIYSESFVKSDGLNALNKAINKF